jgi:DNA-binding CsgD family transcriptional regulator
MRLIERDEELAALRAMFAEASSGHGGVVVVTGTVASGKTAVLRQFAEYAGQHGAAVLGAAASRIESSLPFGLINQLLHDAQLGTERGRRVTQLLDWRGGGEVGAPLLRLLREALLELAERAPLVITVDDVHLADPSSLECLQYLANQIRSTRMLLVITECTGTVPVHPPFLAELHDKPNARQLRLRPLTVSGVAALFARTLPVGVAADLAPSGHRVSGGNPLLARALLEDYRTGDGSASAELFPSDAFGQAVVTCVYRCGPVVVDLARAIAVLGRADSPALLGELLALDEGLVRCAVEALTVAGLIGEGRLRHDAARVAVVGGMTEEERRTMHARAAHLLHRRGLAATAVARHLVAADRITAPWVVPVLLEAAEEALAADGVRLAIECLRLADEGSDGDLQRAAIKSALARAEWRVDPSAAARHLPELTRAVRDGRLSRRHAMTSIGHLLWHGRPDEAVETLDLLERVRANAVGEPESAVDLDAVRLWLCYSYPELAVADRPGHPAASQPDDTEVSSQVQAAGALATVLTRGPEGGAVATAEQVLEGSRLDDSTLAPITAALASLIYANRLARAAFWCDSLLAEAARRSSPMWHALFASIRSTIDFRQGELAAAERTARRALNLISTKAWGVGIGGPLASLLLATTAMGRYDEAARYRDLPVPDAMFQTPFGLHYVHARGRYHLGTGRVQAALDDFQACGEVMTRWGVDLPTLVPWRTDAAQALLRMGDGHEARRLARDQLARLRPEHTRTRGVALRVLAATSDLDRRPDLLTEAADLLKEYGDRFELALTIADLSRVRRALGDRAAADELVARAYRLAARCGAEPLRASLAAEVAAAEPSRPSGPPATDLVAELSDAELRVAVLAAEGHTNREIANRLFVAVSTVEQHLTRVYRKLKVRRRTDLPDELRRRSEPQE